jgi:hypothetical protein
MLGFRRRLALAAATASLLITHAAQAKAQTAAEESPCEIACYAGAAVCCFMMPEFCFTACVFGGGACVDKMCGGET